MIVYSASKSDFNKDVFKNRIVEEVLDCFRATVGYTPALPQIRAFQNSLQFMYNILTDTEIPNDSVVSIEYTIPQSAKRIDFILSGKDKDKRNTAVLIELKQWETALPTNQDGIVVSFVGGAEREVSHPSYQAWSYATLIKDFNEAVEDNNIRLLPCAYLHNYRADDIITNSFYREYLDKAPLFLKDDAEKLRSFIKKFVKYGDSDRIIYLIESGKIRPSKDISEKLLSLLKGNKEFVMIDDQKVLYERSIKLFKEMPVEGGNKKVLIVEGGPGTGKSVVAINLLTHFTRSRFNARYITKNSAPRAVYESMLVGSFKKSEISNFFSGSGSYTECESNAFDVLIADEAHRLNEKSGLFSNKGENQIKEIINASKFSIFFVDEDQRVTIKDIGTKKEIEKWANEFGANIEYAELSSQFRCNGSDGYIAWLDNVLQIRETANYDLYGTNYDFRVFDDPNDLRESIFRLNKMNNKARIVAGYCWDWISKNDYSNTIKDIEIEEYDFSMKWNLASDGGLYVLKKESVREVGCIHTIQGLQLDYVGVIIGKDMLVRNGEVVTDFTHRAKTDASLKGIKSMYQKDPEKARKLAETVIKNTYKTLMTRGAKGCYIFCNDKETSEYFKDRMKLASNSDVK